VPSRRSYEFSQHIGALCVTRGIKVQKLGAKFGVDPTELLSMINGKTVPTKAVISGLARELDSDVRYLEKLAAEIGKDKPI
jgi:transcriptional regulator with XRE-family HTH domain